MARTTFDLLIRHANIVDARGEHGIGDIGISDGVIAAVQPELSGGAGTVIDATGLVVLPGIVDSHAHLTDVDRHAFLDIPGGHDHQPDLGQVSGRSPAHERLAMAGVTTAVEFFDFRAVLDQWHASAAGLTVLGLQDLPTYPKETPPSRIRAHIDSAISDGAIGIKLVGGHYPNTPDISARAIAEADAAACYVAFHAGTTAHGSDLNGMREALQLADGRPMHLAHTNAYLRGAVADLVEENDQALDLLNTHRQVVSEAHLGPLNEATATLDGDAFVDHVVTNCLHLGGYTPDRAGLLRAFADGFAYSRRPDDPTPVTGTAGREIWQSDSDRSTLCFPVNGRLTAFMQACARRDRDGNLCYDGPGEFVVDAICSDGGYWRNVILDQGLALVEFGALTMPQLAHKTSRAPAALFGLKGKGRIEPGDDADVIAVDTARRSVRLTVAAGHVIFDGQRVVGSGGRVVTTEEGVAALRRRGIPCRTVDLADSTFRTKGSAGTVKAGKSSV
jgi:cytosine/adenosine deaminase-related metal-dependent hydrolase